VKKKQIKSKINKKKYKKNYAKISEKHPPIHQRNKATEK